MTPATKQVRNPMKTFTIATPTFSIGPFTAELPMCEDALLNYFGAMHRELGICETTGQGGPDLPSIAIISPELQEARDKYAADCTALVEAYCAEGRHTVVKPGAVRKSLSLSKAGDAAHKNQKPVRAEIQQGVDFEGYDRKIRRQGLNWQTFDTDTDQTEPMPLEPMPTVDSIAAAMRLIG